MKNFLKYFFSIMLMCSCLIVVSMFAYKTLFIDNKTPDGPGADNVTNEEDTDTGEKNPEAAQEEPVDKVPVPDDAPFVTADSSYFKDALFIGDSRTVGLHEYGQIEGADFFATTGMNVYKVRDESVEVAGVGKVTLEQLLSTKHYGKIYLMLGINELGYNMEQTIGKYKELVDWLTEKNPDGILFIQANLHVAAARSDTDGTFNNKRINQFNKSISEFIDNKKIFYIDVNSLFDDEKGNLKAEYTSDNTHIYAKHYVEWRDWLLSKAILPKGADIQEEEESSQDV